MAGNSLWGNSSIVNEWPVNSLELGDLKNAINMEVGGAQPKNNVFLTNKFVA